MIAGIKPGFRIGSSNTGRKAGQSPWRMKLLGEGSSQHPEHILSILPDVVELPKNVLKNVRTAEQNLPHRSSLSANGTSPRFDNSVYHHTKVKYFNPLSHCYQHPR
jgi:hypothetical protein